MSRAALPAVLLALLLGGCGGRGGRGPRVADAAAVVQVQADGGARACPVPVLVGGRDARLHVEDVTEGGAARFAEALAEARDHVLVTISSDGGSVDAVFAMVAAVEGAQRRGVRVVCLVDDHAYSASFALLQSCSERVMTQRSVLLTHQVRAGLTGPILPGGGVVLMNALAAIEAKDLVFGEYCRHRLAVSAADYARHVAEGRDWYLTYRDALAVGAVDRVIWSADDLAP